MLNKNATVRLRHRRLALETLENRRVLAALPFGASVQDTGEFMLGTVAVTPVLLESNGSLDTSTEDWTPSQIQAVLSNVQEATNWWVETLAVQSAIAPLSFTIDSTYATTPVETKYEPIARRSNDYALWVSDFLDTIGSTRTGSLEVDMRAFNQSQRQKLGTDWSYTIFVVPSQNDADGQFQPGGSFNRAFAFAGGLFMVVPSTRPASTYAHESGHIFWARDEYAGGGSYTDRRGYYDTQNTNAVNNPTPGFVQQTSIMAAGSLLDAAYANHISPASTLAMIGWQDSDADGIFDVLDVPHLLTGTGYFDAPSSTYKFLGKATVQTLANLNPSGSKNDITINRIREVEVRFDGGPWQTVSTPNNPQVDLNLSINVPSTATEIDIRVRDSQTTVVSNVFHGRLSRVDATQVPGINGSVWIDSNRNGLRDVGERGQAGFIVQLVDSGGVTLSLRNVIEPDNYVDGELASGFNPRVTLTSVGTDADGRVGTFADAGASTGTKVFRGFSRGAQSFVSTWNASTRRLQANFGNPTSVVQIDAVGASSESYGRLEAYNSAGKLLARTTTAALANGQGATLSITRSEADIAYIIVGAHLSSNIKLDNLQFGPQASTTTDEQGMFAFPGLTTGTYTVRVTPNGSFSPINPVVSSRTAAVVTNNVTGDIDFGYRLGPSAWQNQRDRNDVNDDGIISASDVLNIINDINQSGARDLRGSDTPFRPYIDVTGDNMVSPQDVLQVINFINARGEGELTNFVSGYPAANPMGGGLMGEGEWAVPAIEKVLQAIFQDEEMLDEVLAAL